MIDYSEALFVGWGGIEGVSHYRTILPATELGAEWVVFDMNGKPIAGHGSRRDHKVIIVQNCWYDWQLKMILKMKQTGAVVLFNVDDWIKGIGKREGSHGLAQVFKNKDLLATHERIWAACDGVIASTEWIARKARTYSKNVHVARNGIDPKRYTQWMDVERDMGTIIGWSGGTGHRDALRTISDAVSRVVNEDSDTKLWIVGQDESDLFTCPVHHVQWSEMELYPATLACFDINLAPALENDFYRGKSQLRLYEAWTLGTPTIASPLYDEIRDGVDGFIAETPEEWEQKLRRLCSSNFTREDMRQASLKSAEKVNIHARSQEWKEAIQAAVSISRV